MNTKYVAWILRHGETKAKFIWVCSVVIGATLFALLAGEWAYSLVMYLVHSIEPSKETLLRAAVEIVLLGGCFPLYTYSDYELFFEGYCPNMAGK